LFSFRQPFDESTHFRRKKARRGENGMNAAGRQTPFRQDLDQAPCGKLICNQEIRQHGEPRTQANGFAHGERSIEKDGGLDMRDLSFDVVQREVPPQVVTM
jgi:hypothetical protein